MIAAWQTPQQDPKEPRAGRTPTQRRYLARGLEHPGGKLPLFDGEGRKAARQTVEACIAYGWAEPWFANAIKPDWLVCKLSAAGHQVSGASQGRKLLRRGRYFGEIALTNWAHSCDLDDCESGFT